MASSAEFCIMAFLVLAVSTFQPNLAAEPSAYEGGELDSRTTHYIIDCIEKWGDLECANLVMAINFEGEESFIPPDCCQRLVHMGETCYTMITDALLLAPEFKLNAAMYGSRSAETWEICSEVAPSLHPLAAPSPSF